jgi:lipopolysaccharide assembly outer membrane protein LptD (OstA)
MIFFKIFSRFFLKSSFVITFLIFSLLPEAIFAENPPSLDSSLKREVPIEATADKLEYLRGEKKIIARGNVVVIYEESKLTSDYAEIFTDTKKAYAEGHVTIYQQGGMLRGEKVFYNFKTHQGSFPGGTAMQAPWYGTADQMDQVSRDKVQLYNALFTTCPLDQGDPHYVVSAKRAVLYPGDRFIAYDVKFKILGKTVFWVPYLNIPLDSTDPPIVLQPGHSKQWGWYGLMSKTFKLTKNINLRAHLDLYEKRGIGAGGDAFYNFESLRSSGFVKTYYIEDKDAPVDSNVDANGQDNPYSKREERDRYRITNRHRTDFSDYTNVFFQYNKFSDEFFLQDFFESEFRGDMQPQTFGVLTRNTEGTGLFVNTLFQTNDFFDTTEELPQVRYDWNNQRIGRSQLFYRNQTGLTNFKQKFAYKDEENDAWRFDTLHRFSLPKKWKSVEILPVTGFRETYYTNSRGKNGEQNRLNLEAGVDFKTQAAKIYDWSGKFAGMEFNKVRHLVEPTIGFHDTESVGTKTTKLFQFDEIDSLGRRREADIGFENRIQTKRKRGKEWERVDVVSLNTYLFFNANTDEPGFRHTTGFTSLRNTLTVRPYDWLMAEWDSDFNMMSADFNTSDLDIILSYKDKFSILIGHRYLKSDGPIEGNNVVVLDISYKINSRWTAGGYVRTEFETGQVQEWELRLIRDLSCGWFLDLGYNVRNSDIDENNNSLYARLTLIPLHLSFATGAKASFADPRIGDRVAGSDSTYFTRNALGQWRAREYQNIY